MTYEDDGWRFGERALCLCGEEIVFRGGNDWGHTNPVNPEQDYYCYDEDYQVGEPAEDREED